MHDNITDVKGIKVGHKSDFDRLTGCTVVLIDGEAIGGMDCRGSAAGLRQANALDPLHQVPCVNGIFLAGGSAFGLDAAVGVMDYLEEKGEGFQTPVARIPIVPTAILFDLSLGDPKGRPTREMAYQACQEAVDGHIPFGSIGAGTGASVGKLFGIYDGDVIFTLSIGDAEVDLHTVGLLAQEVIRLSIKRAVIEEKRPFSLSFLHLHRRLYHTNGDAPKTTNIFLVESLEVFFLLRISLIFPK